MLAKYLPGALVGGPERRRFGDVLCFRGMTSNAAELVDIGANLTNKAFRSDLGAVLARAREQGVRQIVVTGTSEEASREACELARAHEGFLFATAGVHPHHARDFGSKTLDVLAGLAKETGVVAIGECGLDYDRNFSPRPAQRRCFEAQLELASELALPLFLHERAAHADLLELVARHRPKLARAVVHCFTGSEAELSAYLELDLYIGITGWICDERRGAHLAALIRMIPSERLMLETDAPYLLPRTLKLPASQRRNEPAYLPAVLDAVARATGRARADVARDTTETARAFFALTAPR